MMVSRRKHAAWATVLLSRHVLCQSYTSCNPRQATCPADTALAMAVNVDFTQGAVNSFASSGNVAYDSNGATLTVAQSGDNPVLSSMFYIMFGRVEVSLKPAPGAGIVSSFVLQSDCLDEIDWEWLGADDGEVQTNYFGKGQTTTYNRGQFNDDPDNQADFKTYTIDWTSDRIVWVVDGTQVRSMTYDEADTDQYPQTPMRVKMGLWSGGDSSNAEGTVSWARGPTDYSKGPFKMSVKSVTVTDYSTGKSYSYSDTSGGWQSITSDGGTINGNLNSAGSLTVTASAPGATGSSPSIPMWRPPTEPAVTVVSGATGIPSGWVMLSNGKIVPSGSEKLRTPSIVLLASPFFIFAVVFLFNIPRT